MENRKSTGNFRKMENGKAEVYIALNNHRTIVEHRRVWLVNP